MALGEPRDVEKLARIPPTAMRSATKDMVGLKRSGLRRGNDWCRRMGISWG